MSNTGHTAVSGSLAVGRSGSSNYKVAQPFTTGDNDLGYTLTGIGLGIKQWRNASSDLTASIWTTTSTGVPRSLLYTLTNPASPADNAINTFTAPADAALDARTTYALVLDLPVQKSIILGPVETIDEDAGAASGWSIANVRAFKENQQAWSVTTDRLYRISVSGTVTTDGTAPTFSSAAANNATLALTFDEALDGGSVPAPGAFTVTVAGAGRSVASGGVAVDGRTVTLMLASAVSSGETVAVRYTNPGSANNPLRDAAGNEVATFADQTVTNETTAKASVSSVAIVSKPRLISDTVTGVKDTYGRGQAIVVAVTWDKAVTWDVSAASNAGIGVRVNVGGTNRRAELVTGGATSGTAETLWFSYTVLGTDSSDTDGVAVTTASGSKLVLLRNGAALTDDEGRNAKVTHAGLAADAAHMVKTDTAASGNSAPVFDDGDPNTGSHLGIINTPSGTLVHVEMHRGWFSDPDGDPLTFTLTADREDAFAELRLQEVAGLDRLFMTAVSNCTLANFTPVPPDPLVVVASLTATDPDGASVTATHSANMVWDCPSFASASAAGAKLKIEFTGDGALVGDAELYESYLGRLSADDIEVKVGGVAAALSAKNPVSVSGSTVTLSMAAPIAAGEQVTVSYTPGEEPGAVAFADQPVDNDATGLTGATVNGNTVTLNFNRSLTAVLDPTNQAPSAWDLGTALERLSYVFYVSGAYLDGARLQSQTTGVSISGSTVRLSLGDAAALPGGGGVTVTYDAAYAPTVGVALRDSRGEPVPGFTRTATNVTGGTQRPLLTAAQVAGNVLRLTFSQALDERSAPAGRRFRLMVQPDNWYDDPRFIHGTGTAAVQGATVTVDLDAVVGQGAYGLIQYIRGDDANPLRGAAGANPEVDDFGSQFGKVDRTTPTLDSAFAAQSLIYLYYSEKLDTNSTPAAGAFTVTKGSTSYPVSLVNVYGDALILHLSLSGGAGAFTVAYAVPEANPIRDRAGNAAAAFSGLEVPDTSPTAAPTVTGAETDGKRVTLAFDLPLRPDKVPAASAFAVKDLATGWTRTLRSVSVRGSRVVLDVDSGIHPCTEATVDYTQPGTNPLINLKAASPDQVASFSGQSITNGHAHRCVHGAFIGASMESRSNSMSGGDELGPAMRLRFDRSLQRRSVPNKEAFTVTSGPAPGAAPILVDDVRMLDDPTALLLTLSRPVSDEEQLTLNYRLPQSGPGLRDTDDNQLAPFSTRVATDGPPAAAAVALVSDPGDDATYAAGDTIRVHLTFSEAVEVGTEGGTPRLQLDLGGDDGAGERWAAYADGTGTDALTFAYAAASGDLSAGGVAVLADTLELNGGTIGSAASGTAAALGHAGLAQDAAHRVDAVPPQLLRGEIDGGTMTLYFSEALDPDSTGGRFEMGVQTSETKAVGFTARGAVAVDGATVTVGMGAGYPRAQAGLLERNHVLYLRLADGSDGAVRDLAGNPVLTPHRTGFGDGREWRYIRMKLANVTGAAPAVTGVAVVSDAGTDKTYGLGDTIRVRAAFSEAVDVTGSPRLKIKMDPRWGEFWAAYEDGSGTRSLTFAYRVAEPNTAPIGMAVLANTLELNGGTIRAGDEDAALAHAGLRHDGNHKVDWKIQPEAGPAGTSVNSGPPSVTGVAVSSRPAADDRYLLGETIRIRVTFSEPVTVTGRPRLSIDMDPAHWGTKRAAYESGSGTNALTFAHEVVRPNISTRGIAVLANTLALNGGTVRSAATQAAARLGHAGLSHDPKHKVDWRAALSVADARANEGADAVVFEVRLDRAAPRRITMDYATADGTATAGEDYTATSGTLTFAVGERTKTVNVPLLDDAIDEGEETFLLRLSNADGARIADGEATGTIVNADPLQKMWLSRFGRTVAGHVTEAVSDRLANPLSGAQVTVGGQSVNLAETGDEAFLGRTLTSVARALGAPDGPEPEGDPWPGTGLGIGKSSAPGSAPAREISGRELLLGTAFHLAREGDGTGPNLAAWGRVTAGGFDGEAPADGGTVRIDGAVTTGVLAADAEWNRLLAGVALSVSEGEGTFAQPGVDSGTIESTMTTVSPYARYMVNDRVSVWGLAGFGNGDMTITQAANDRGQPERISRTDLEMRLAALGGRGALLEADEAGGIDLALKADAFHVETEAEAVSNEGSTTAEASRVRLILEGGRAFELEGGATLRPSLELGLRHDGGDAETGTGVELGGGVSYADPATGLSVEAKARMLVAHADSDYREWGVSGAVRLAPGERGRGLSFSLAPTLGAASSGAGRLWGARDAGGLAPGGAFEAARGLAGELGYGLALLGDRFTGTPNLGFGLSDAARDYRIGWRLTSAVRGDPGFEVNLDATRREAANGNEPPEHGVMLRGAIRW